MAAEMLMVASVVLMLLIVGFLLLVNRAVQRQHREQLGDLRHIKIPDDPRDAASPRKRPKPPYRLL